MKKIAILGAGPAGIYCAINILEEFKKLNFEDFFLYIFDKNQALRTILPTGNGRCNLTNATSDLREFCSNYPRGEKFLYSVFSRYCQFDTIDFFKSIGLETYIQDDNRIFPKSNKASDVKNVLLNKLKEYKNYKLINKNVKTIDDIKEFDYKIVAVGSRNVENLLKSLNQPFVPFKKALCGLKIENNIYPAGVSVKSLDGDFIFTHDGISGPLVFKISSDNAFKDFPYELKIHLFNKDDLIKEVKNNPKKSIGNLVSKFIPKSLAQVIVKDYSKNACEISKIELENYSYLNLKVIDTLLNGEIVNAGGVELNSIDKNFKSKINNNLWFCGEVLNIDGYCGGFNLQNCWSSGYIVAIDVVKEILNF